MCDALCDASRTVFGLTNELYACERMHARFTHLELGQFTDTDRPRGQPLYGERVKPQKRASLYHTFASFGRYLVGAVTMTSKYLPF